MIRWPEMQRLCSLLAERDEVPLVAVVAVVDQLAARAAEEPSTVTRVHAAFGHAAADWVLDPTAQAESRLVVAHRAAMAITRAASVVDDVAEPTSGE